MHLPSSMSHLLREGGLVNWCTHWCEKLLLDLECFGKLNTAFDKLVVSDSARVNVQDIRKILDFQWRNKNIKLLKKFK